MRKVGLGIGLLMLTAVGVGRVADPAQSAPSDKVCFEAEKAKSIKQYFVKRRDPFKDKRNNLSSEGYIEIEEHIHKKNGLEGQDYYPGVVTYEVNVPQAGSYLFWARTWWSDDPNGCGCSNSFWVQFGDQADQLFGEDATYGVWKWRKLKKPVTLPAGKVMIRLKDREDGIRIDQILLMKQTRRVIVPMGKMPVTPGALAHATD